VEGNLTNALDAKEAARLADAGQNQVYAAIYRGVLKTERKEGRVLILRDSFERWRRRLETRRALRAEEQELVKG
jgi:Helix-turn-helix domain